MKNEHDGLVTIDTISHAAVLEAAALSGLKYAELQETFCLTVACLTALHFLFVQCSG